MKKTVGRFHVLTDRVRQDRFDHLELSILAIEGGADAIQLREKRAEAGELIRIAASLREVCAARGVALIVNDRPDVALAAGADGVHLGQADFPVAAARDLAGPDLLIGASASSVDEARRAEDAGADYIGFGHVYATSTKSKQYPPRGVAALAGVCAAVSIPVIAVGGIEASRVDEVLGAGAWGLAVSAAVCGQPDPREAARRIRSGLDPWLSRR